MSFFRRKPKTSAATTQAAAPAAAASAAAPTAVAEATSGSVLTGDYTIDPSHTRLGFSARHAMVTTVRGQFTDFEGTAHVDAENPAASSVSLSIRPASISTGSADRDGHLVSADFFDVENHGEITFASTAVTPLDGDVVRIEGDLTMKGVTKPVAIDFAFEGSAVDPFGNQRIGFEGSLVVNRKDWGVNWNTALDTGGVLVSEKVTLEFDVSAIRTEAS